MVKKLEIKQFFFPDELLNVFVVKKAYIVKIKFYFFVIVWFYKNQFKSGKKICKVTQPVLFISGLMDKVSDY